MENDIQGGSPQFDEVNDIDGFFRIKFQTGSVPQNGRNGTTIERILGVLWERLQGFQHGPLPCHENEVAIAGLNMAMNALADRTLRRIEQGVEGTDQPHVTPGVG